MNWYYVESGRQNGPVTEEALATLAAQGAVTPETLVWREGLEEWLPYKAIKPAAPPVPVAPPGQVICCECRGAFSPDDVVRHGEVYVCAACKPIFLQKLREGVVPSVSMTYAGFWIRAGAKILDGLIVGVPTQLLSALVLVGLGGGRRVPFVVLPVVYSMALLIQVSYYVFFLGKYGATPGKMIAKLRVVRADGTPISYGTAGGRFLAEIVSAIICYIGYIMVAFDDEKRGLHDRMCNTRVVRK